MSWALRWLVVGAAIATALHLVIDPPLGVLLAAVWVGFLIGVAVYLMGRGLSRMFGWDENPR